MRPHILNKAVEAICKDFLPCPDTIPVSWAEMSQSEQAMTAWFARRHLGAKDLEALARHAVASTAHKKGEWNFEEADTIFVIFYPKSMTEH